MTATFGHWVIFSAFGILFGAGAFFPWAAGSIAYAALVQRKLIHPMLLVILGGWSLYKMQPPTGFGQPKFWAIGAKVFSIVMVAGCFAFYQYCTWWYGLGGFWDPVKSSAVRAFVSESSFPLFMLLTWGLLVYFLERHLRTRKVRPETVGQVGSL